MTDKHNQFPIFSNGKGKAPLTISCLWVTSSPFNPSVLYGADVKSHGQQVLRGQDRLRVPQDRLNGLKTDLQCSEICSEGPKTGSEIGFLRPKLVP